MSGGSITGLPSSPHPPAKQRGRVVQGIRRSDGRGGVRAGVCTPVRRSWAQSEVGAAARPHPPHGPSALGGMRSELTPAGTRPNAPLSHPFGVHRSAYRSDAPGLGPARLETSRGSRCASDSPQGGVAQRRSRGVLRASASGHPPACRGLATRPLPPFDVPPGRASTTPPVELFREPPRSSATTSPQPSP